MIPLRDANPTKRFPVVTLALIAANVAVFLLWQPSFGTQLEQQTFYYCHAEIPWEVSHQENLAQGGLEARVALDADLGPGAGADIQPFLRRECPNKSWWLAIFVAMFLHGGWFHIAGKMLFLWVFGNNVEDRLGYVVYPLFYVLGGLAASALQLAFGANSTIPSLGASGAIGGILGAYIVLFPHARVTTLVSSSSSRSSRFPRAWCWPSGSCSSSSAAWVSSGRMWAVGWRTGRTSAGSRSARWWPGSSTGDGVGSGRRRMTSGGPVIHGDNIRAIISSMDAAETLRDARRRAGLSQRGLARRAHTPQPTIARIESHAVVPRVDTLDRLLAACGVALATVPRTGAGIDRTQIRDLRALSPGERLRLAAREGRNLDRLLTGATRR